jgi:hypothetical protein
MEEKPLIDPVWRRVQLDDWSRWRLHLVGAQLDYLNHAVASVNGESGAYMVWRDIDEHGDTSNTLRVNTPMPVEDAKRACEQALRGAGYRFANDPPRGSMTRGLPLADELDPAAYLPHAIAALHDVLKVGAERYPDEKWKTQNVAEHLRHAREHIRLHTIGDDSEPHLRHALTRLAFAVEIAEGGGK